MTKRKRPTLAIDMNAFETTLKSVKATASEKQEIIEDIWDMLYTFAAYGFVLRQTGKRGKIAPPLLGRPPRRQRYLVTTFNRAAKSRRPS